MSAVLALLVSTGYASGAQVLVRFFAVVCHILEQLRMALVVLTSNSFGELANKSTLTVISRTVK